MGGARSELRIPDSSAGLCAQGHGEGACTPRCARPCLRPATPTSLDALALPCQNITCLPSHRSGEPPTCWATIGAVGEASAAFANLRLEEPPLRFRLNSVIIGVVQHVSTSSLFYWVRALTLAVLIALLSHGTAVAGGASCDDAPRGTAGDVHATDGTNAHPGDVAHPEKCCAISICGTAIVVVSSRGHYDPSAPLPPRVASQGLIGHPIPRVERPPIAA